jgi:pyridoxamine 5'-phosphate oxidase family protein
VAFVVDNMASMTRWRVRGIKVRGEVEVLPTGGQEVRPGFDPEMFRMRARRIVSWGIEGDAFRPHARSVP